MFSIVTAKGQVTIPAEIRRQANIKPGTLVTFQLKPSRRSKAVSITIMPVASKKEHPVSQLYGSLNTQGRIKYIPLRRARKLLAKKMKQKYK